MITVNELRIGNYINLNVNTPEFTQCFGGGRVTEIRSDGFALNGINVPESLFKWAEPIPLTPELLEQFGFKLYNLGVFDYHYKYFTQTDAKGCEQKTKFSLGRNGTEVFINDRWLCGIKYLHQLQNLFFSLSGEELNINLTKAIA